MIKKYIKKILIPSALFLTTFTVYANSISPGVYGGDSGDFLTAVLTRGVAHPSGYPLYTILGIIFTSLPGTWTFAWKYGLVSALFSSLSIVLFYFVVVELVKNKYLAVATSLTLAFTYPFCLFAEIVEVFALQSALVLSLILTTVKYINSKKKKYLYWLAALAGLSLTNNLSIIILYPPIILAVIAADKRIIFDYKTILKGICLFLLGLTPYLYIPLAAKNFPFMNWGVAVNLKNFFDLVSRKYYSWGLTDTHERFNPEIISYRFGAFVDYWKTYVHNLIPFLAISGFFQLIRKKKYLILFFFTSSFFLFGPFFTVYSGTYFKSFLSIATLEKFYITTLIVSFLFLPFGFNLYLEILGKIRVKKIFLNVFKKTVFLIALLIPLSSFLTNYPKTNFSNVNIGDNLAKDVLENIPEGSVLLLRNDSLSFNTIYYQKAHTLNESVSIPGPHNGFDILLKTFVDEKEIQNYKVKHQGTMDRDNLNASIGPLMEKHDVYIDGLYSLTDSKYGKIVTVPFGLVYKFEFYDRLPYPKEEYLNRVETIIDKYHLADLSSYPEVTQYSLVLADIKKLYSDDIENVAIFLHEQYQEEDLAKKLLQKSIEIDPLVKNN